MMGEVIMSGIVPQLVAPVNGTLLADIAEGSAVKINENGVPVAFYVAKHDYESGLNGTGRTLLVRKDCLSERGWQDVANSNNYATSDISKWLVGDYNATLDDYVREAIGSTKFYYTTGGSTKNVEPLEMSVFLLSLQELGLTHSSAKSEGSTLPIASLLRIAYKDGAAVNQWTRTRSTADSTRAIRVSSAGEAVTTTTLSGGCPRPCFTLPDTAYFDEETLILKGVA